MSRRVLRIQPGIAVRTAGGRTVLEIQQYTWLYIVDVSRTGNVVGLRIYRNRIPRTRLWSSRELFGHASRMDLGKNAG